ncbi:hypothetical protein GCM10010289_25370 [Streptomyces violascens]|uniref:Uncharacterized protein n=1 Tax=Streptomyces violascens TaxID=67381 RepID=A0ABQ3QI24_9ACTN|nr:hypothetical protein GCM10010289_25370 [Streptomyces violascens]GHI36936.1 hypothetical protein Sviol_13440 [Streptomyces violascens]
MPNMTYDEDRDLHAKRFAREDDDSLSAYFEKKDHIATSVDGLPGLPLPLPGRAVRRVTRIARTEQPAPVRAAGRGG